MYTIQTLDDIKGNTAIIITLKNLLKAGKFPKFTLLHGQMGVGKTSAAKVIASTLMCGNDAHTSPVYFETTAGLDITELNATYIEHAPMETVVIVLEEIHALSREVQTGLLSLIDNLPPTVYVIATTTEVSKLLKPLQSRAQLFEFKRLSMSELNSVLDIYLDSLNKVMSSSVREAIIHKAKGIPRDMFKDVDLVLNSEIDDGTARDLFNYIDDSQAYTIFSTLKGNVVEFIDVLSILIEDKQQGLLLAVRDFWTKFMLCKLGGNRTVMDRNNLKVLESLYEDVSELILITKTLSKSTDKTIELDLINLCMRLNNTKEDDVRGTQLEAQRSNNAELSKTFINEQSIKGAKISSGFISKLKL